MGCPTATMPASSDVRATDLWPIDLRTYARSREENLSPWDTTASP